MKLKQRLLGIGALAIVLGACNADYKKTKDGMAYKIFAEGKGPKIKHGDMLKVHISNQLGDSVIFSSFEHIAKYGTYDSSVKMYDFVDFMGEMKVGDSAVYSRSVDSMVKRQMLQYTDKIKPGGTITGSIKILKVFANEAAMRADFEEEMKLEKDRELVALDKFLKEKNITNTQKVGDGVLVKMEREGTGPFIDTNQVVKVNYTGSLKNGNKFDSNVDSAFQHVAPMEFVVGQGQVIPGWDQGIRAFKKGGKGVMYIPAMLAYGMQAQGEKLPAFSDLVFEIEVLDVKQAPPVAPQPMGAPIQ